MIGWLIFGAYVLVGAMRMPTYFELAHAYQKEEFPYGYEDGGGREGNHVSSAWMAFGMAAFWVITELYRGTKRVILFYLLRGDTERRLRREDLILEEAQRILMKRHNPNHTPYRSK